MTENGKKKSPWVIAATVIGAAGTVIAAVAALLSAMDAEKTVSLEGDKNELMLESLFNYSTTNIGDLKESLGRVEGELGLLMEICTQQNRPECTEDGECRRGQVCQRGRCVRFGHRRPAALGKPDKSPSMTYESPVAESYEDEDELEVVIDEVALKDDPAKRNDMFQAIQQKAQMGEAWDGDWKALKESPSAE